VLGIQFVKNRHVNLALVSYQDMTLEMNLYSKPQKKTAWHKAGAGWFVGGLAHSVGPSEEKIRSMLEPIMEEAFGSLPHLPE